MKILRGKNAGDGYTVHQWANDWMTVDGHGKQSIVVKPVNVQLDESEYQAFCESYLAAQQGDRSKGTFWHEWELRMDGTFTRRPALVPEQSVR